MKKITRTVITALTLLSLTLTPAAVRAQEVEEVPAETPAPVAAPADGTKTAGVPNTGLAPKDSLLGANVAIFTGGGLLGAALGLGIVTLKKQKHRSKQD